MHEHAHDRGILYVVYDTKGAGRVVGVFDALAIAQRVAEIDRPYYRIFRSEINHVRPEAVEWLNTADQRRALTALIESIS